MTDLEMQLESERAIEKSRADAWESSAHTLQDTVFELKEMLDRALCFGIESVRADALELLTRLDKPE